MLKIYSIKIQELTRAEYIKEYTLLSYTQRKTIAIKSYADKCRSLAALILLRTAIKENFQIENYEITYNENGKPLLPFCHFCIAHSDDLVIVAISDNPVGVDVERIREIKKRNDYKLFSFNEVKYVNSSPVGIALRFFEIWTKKEAYIKLNGLKLSDAAKFDIFKLSEVIFKSEISEDYYTTICIKNDPISK